MQLEPPLNILLLSDGIPGHVNQSKGLIKLIESNLRPVEEIECHAKLIIKWTRPLMRHLLNKHSALSKSFIRGCYAMAKLPLSAPNLIVSAGGNTSFLNAALAGHYNCKNLFIGSLRKLKAELFTAVLTLEPIASPNNIVLAIAPTPVSMEDARKAGEQYKKDCSIRDKPLWTMILGGDGAGYRYHASDWSDLATGMVTLAKKNDIRWLLTTSRRTGIKTERKLQSLIPSTILAEAVWYNHKPKKVMLPFLGAGDKVFCTADSMSMITEAIASGKAPQLITPEIASPNSRYTAALEKFERQKIISMSSIKDMTNTPRTSENNDIEQILADGYAKLVNELNALGIS